MQEKSLARNGIYKALLNIFNLVVPLLVGPYITGLLNEELYGIYNRVYTEYSVFLALASFGIYNYGVREISRVRNDPAATNKLFTSLFLIGIVSNGAAMLVYVAYTFWRSNSQIEVYVYLVMLIQLFANIFYVEFANEAKENYRFIMVKTILVRLGYLISIFVFVRKPSDVVPYAVVISMTNFVNNILSYIKIRRDVHFDFGGLTIKKHLFPLVVSLVIVNVDVFYFQLDKIMLSPLVSDIAVTEYYIPTNMVGMVSAVPHALIYVAIPRVSALLGEGKRDEYIRVLQTTTEKYLALVIPINFGFIVLAQEVMQLYTRDVYTYAWPVLVVAAISRIVLAYQAVLNNLVLYVNSREKQQVTFLAIFGAVNLAMNFALVALGCFTVITSLATTTLAVMMFVIVCQTYSIKKLGVNCHMFSKRSFGYLLASALFIPLSLLIRMAGLNYWVNIAAIIIACVALYAAYLILTRDMLAAELLNATIFRGRNRQKE